MVWEIRLSCLSAESSQAAWSLLKGRRLLSASPVAHPGVVTSRPLLGELMLSLLLFPLCVGAGQASLRLWGAGYRAWEGVGVESAGKVLEVSGWYQQTSFLRTVNGAAGGVLPLPAWDARIWQVGAQSSLSYWPIRPAGTFFLKVSP